MCSSISVVLSPMNKNQVLLRVSLLLTLSVFLISCSSGSKTSNLIPGANLVGAELQGQDLTEIDISGANLTGANLSSANLTNSNLRGANLTQANLTGANFTNADLSGANLTGAVVQNADFSNASLMGATFDAESFAGLKGIPTTTLPPTTTSTNAPQPQATYAPTQTTSKPVYIIRTDVRTVAKTLPNGPWTCERTYVYSDGHRTRESFKSESECSD